MAGISGIESWVIYQKSSTFHTSKKSRLTSVSGERPIVVQYFTGTFSEMRDKIQELNSQKAKPNAIYLGMTENSWNNTYGFRKGA